MKYKLNNLIKELPKNVRYSKEDRSRCVVFSIVSLCIM